MKYFKAFHKGMTCMGKQYQENTVYEEEGRDICKKGMMHFCETPFDTLNYYPLIDDSGEFSEFAEVEPLDAVLKSENKCASKKIRIGAKMSFNEFVKAGIDVLIETTKPGKMKDTDKLNDEGKYVVHFGSSGDEAKIGSSGYRTKIGSSGDCAKIGSSGFMAQIGSSGALALIGSSGTAAQIGSSGDEAKIGSSGTLALISSSGFMAQIGSSGDYAKIGSSGDCANIGSSGDEAKIGSSGDEAKIKMKGNRSVAAAVGCNCCISGKKGDWITLAEWKRDDKGWYPACVKSSQIDGKTLLEDVPYKLEDGEFVRCN